MAKRKKGKRSSFGDHLKAAKSFGDRLKSSSTPDFDFGIPSHEIHEINQIAASVDFGTMSNQELQNIVDAYQNLKSVVDAFQRLSDRAEKQLEKNKAKENPNEQ